MMEEGRVVRLIIANKNLGKWTIRKVAETWRHMLKGQTGPLALSLSLDIAEYQ